MRHWIPPSTAPLQSPPQSRAALLGELYAALSCAAGLAAAPFLDPLGAVLFLLSAFLLWAVTRFSRRYLAGDPAHARFTAWLCLTGTCVFSLVLAQNLLLFAAAWSATSLGLHQLLTFYKRPSALLAARKKFLISRLGDLCLFSATALAWLSFGTLDFETLFRAAAAPSAHWIAVLLVFAALLKSAQFPFHSWLPDTMDTPTPVSALMHAGIINAGGILVIRLSPLIGLSSAAMNILLLAGAFTALFAGIVMLTQASVKRALAFSTVAQMGFMMLECGLGAFHLALLHIVAHSLFKAHAFLSSGRAAQSAPPPARTAPSLPVLFAALGAALAATAALAHLSPGAPSHLELQAIFALALAQMLWTLWHSSASPWRLPAGLALAAASTAAYAALESASALLVRPLPSHAASLGALVVAAFAAAALADSYLPRLAAHPRLAPLWVHARNGFYLNTLANRFTLSLWPLESTKGGN